MLKKIFDTEIFIKENINFDEVDIGTSFYKDLDNKLSMDCPHDPNSIGIIQSTLQHGINFFYLKDFSKLWKILYPYFQEFAEHIIGHKRDIGIARIWSNRMLTGSQVTIHKHDTGVQKFSVDFVGIFYYSTPENSSKFVLVDSRYEEAKRTTPLNNIPEKYKYEISVSKGMLLCHHKGDFHGMTEHLSLDPRISIIIELKII